MQIFFCRIFSLFGETNHASKDRNGSSWVREPPNLLLSVFGRTGPAEKVPRADGLQDRTEGSCNPSIKIDNLDTNVGVRTFCPTRWTVKNEALHGILVNYDSLKQSM